MNTKIQPDFIAELQRVFTGEIRTDFTSRLLYSTDASIYQIEPLGVAFPRTAEDLAAAVETAARFEVPILARGSGSSLAGQAIGQALILDCSRHLNHIVEINPETYTATAEPGVILNTLNKAAAVYGLQFGPDPASAERATLGGSIANNAAGAHSIVFGMCADHLLSADVVLSDGSLAVFCEIPRLKENGESLIEAERPIDLSIEAAIYQTALHIRDHYASAIRTRWPRTYRNASGYNLNYLLPWYPAAPPRWQANYNPSAIYNLQLTNPNPTAVINLAPLLAGSEGTLAVIHRATVQLVPLPRNTILGILAFPSIAEACDAVPELLTRGPSAVELIPQILIKLARSVPALAQQLSFLNPIAPAGSEPPALLVIEYSGDEPQKIKEQVSALGSRVLVADTSAAQKQVWNVRKMGLGILQSRPGDLKSTAFIEDIAVPVIHLGEFVREIEKIFAEHQTTADYYAHASAGCLHIRPLLNLKTRHGLVDLRSISTQVSDLVLRLNGTMSGEHGDGLARGEWLEKLYGTDIAAAFRELKHAADPKNILNPGKIVDPPPMDQNLRYSTALANLGWQPTLDFTRQGGASGAAGYLGAVEMCNGAGVCRKTDGVMCPSFQATQEEMHSTRGRANLLRALLYGQFKAQNIAEANVKEALDLCLACKGCKSECPSAVDMAKLKYEFSHYYYKNHNRRIRDYIFGYIHRVAPLGAAFAPITNWMMSNSFLRQLAEKWLGLAAARPFPKFSSIRNSLFERKNLSEPDLLLLTDTFNHYFYPATEAATIQVLKKLGYRVQVLPVFGAGRTLISKGFLQAAKRQAQNLVDTITRLDPQSRLPIVGIEPSEIYTLRDEYLELLPGDIRIPAIAARSYLIDEFLLRPNPDGQPRIHSLNIPIVNPRTKIFIHGHCYQKARPPAADGYPTGITATVMLLEGVGYEVNLIEDGCCGMAGAFGYEIEHYALSMKIGELALFPAIRSVTPKTESDIIIVAAGVSCQAQIEDGTGQRPLHPVMLLV